jgi:hypothetical protein
MGPTGAGRKTPIRWEDPTTLAYLYQYDIESAYLDPRGETRPHRHAKNVYT